MRPHPVRTPAEEHTTMHRLVCVTCLVLLGSALLVSSGVSQEKKDKAKGQLPPGWKKLDLSKDQISKIYDIQGKYRGKIRDLEKQIADLKIAERTDMAAVLTPEQKDLYRKLQLGEDTKKSSDK